MGVTVYRSTDSSAPTLSGTAGDLVNLLDKVLVAGYGAKTAAGWTKPYTAANKAVFRMGGGNQFYLDIDDSAPGAGGAKEARARGYEQMTAVGTGSYPFPTIAQIALIGSTWRKSATADATTRTWTAIADEKTLYLLIQCGDTASQWKLYMFGDFYSYVTGDDWRTAIIVKAAENSAIGATDACAQAFCTQGSVAQSGHYFARGASSFGGAIQFYKQMNQEASGGGTSAQPFGNSSNNLALIQVTNSSMYVGKVYVGQPTNHIRGHLRGWWAPPYMNTLVDGDTFSGDPGGTLAGKTFMLFKTGPNNTGGGYVFEISDTWDESA